MRRDPNASRKKILAAAGELFYRHGIRAVAMDAVVAQAGVAKATVYRHFSSKDALVAAFLHAEGERQVERLRERLNRPACDAVTAILGVFDGIGAWLVATNFRGTALINAVAEFPEATHPAHTTVRQYLGLATACLSQFLTRAGVDHADALSRQLVLLMTGAIVTGTLERDPTSALVAKEIARHLLASQT